MDRGVVEHFDGIKCGLFSSDSITVSFVSFPVAASIFASTRFVNKGLAYAMSHANNAKMAIMVLIFATVVTFKSQILVNRVNCYQQMGKRQKPVLQ
jgi:hypothetical protein